MNAFKTPPLATLAIVLGIGIAAQAGPTVQDFDNAGTNYGTFGNASAPVAGGPTGNFGRLTPALNSQFGRIAFDQAETQTASSPLTTGISGHFDFRAIPTAEGSNQADGFSLYLIPTSGGSGQGTTGDFTIQDTAEHGRINGGLGFGFNDHQGGGDLSNNSIYLDFNNNAFVQQVNAPFDFSTSDFHRALFNIDYVTGGANVSLSLIQDINGAANGPQAVFSGVFIPGLNPYDYRVGFAGRTGGQNADHQIDNILVETVFLPEPTTAVLGLLSVAGLALRRRRTS